MITEKIKERPIIFTGESPKWILDGRKTQTRRTNGLDSINLNPISSLEKLPSASEFKFLRLCEYENYLTALFVREKIEEYFEIKCPYGKPGDHLWVRETWKAWEDESGQDYLHYKTDDKKIIPDWPNESEYWNRLVGKFDKWQSPRFMPRWASRINLEITNIRVERLQDISNNDALFEGCIDIRYAGNEAELFKKLWDSINKKRGYGWSVNPHVWVIEFKKI